MVSEFLLGIDIHKDMSLSLLRKYIREQVEAKLDYRETQTRMREIIADMKSKQPVVLSALEELQGVLNSNDVLRGYIENIPTGFKTSPYVEKLNKKLVSKGLTQNLVNMLYSPKKVARDWYPNLIKMAVDHEEGYRMRTLRDPGSALSNIELYGREVDSIVRLPQIVNEFYEEVVLPLEAKKEKFDFDEPEGGELGKIAFGEERLDDVPFEKDTHEERDLYDGFVEQIFRNEKLNSSQIAVVKKLLRDKKYPKFFKEPNVDVLYRGIAVTEDWLEKKLDFSPEDSGVSSEGYVDDGRMSSWTVDELTAEKFAKDSVGRTLNSWVVVLKTHVSKNPGCFLDLTDGIYALDRFVGKQSEQEVFGFGPIEVESFEWKKAK